MTEEQAEIVEEEVQEEEDGSSRRSFMKKGAVAAGAVALGGAATGTAAAQGARVLVFSYDYYPGVQFRVRAPLQASTTVRILRRQNGQRVPEIDNPSDYNGYVISYNVGNQGQGGIYTFLFTRRNLQNGSTHRLSGQAQVFSSALNLLDTNINNT